MNPLFDNIFLGVIDHEVALSPLSPEHVPKDKHVIFRRLKKPNPLKLKKMIILQPWLNKRTQ